MARFRLSDDYREVGVFVLVLLPRKSSFVSLSKTLNSRIRGEGWQTMGKQYPFGRSCRALGRFTLRKL